jgi:hypothetical protein
MAETTVDALLSEADQPSDLPGRRPGELAGKVLGLEDRLAEFMGVVVRLQQTVETQGALLDRVAEAMGLGKSTAEQTVTSGSTAAGQQRMS